MAGKNKTLRWMRLFVGGYDLSGDARTFDRLENGFAEADLTGWSEGVRNFLAGDARATGVRGFQAILNDATTGALTLLKQTAPTNRVLSMLFGGGAEPAIADPAYLLGAVQMGDVAALDGLTPVLAADFLPEQGQFSDNSRNPFGVVLSPATSLSATTNQASVDHGASSANGGHANLHITASSGGTWAFKIEHSTNDSAWSTLISFTLTGSALASERLTVSGTVNRYTRFVATRTGGTVTPVCAFARS